MPMVLLQFISVRILSASQVMASLLNISHILQKPCAQPSLFSCSASGTPNRSSNLAHFATSIAPITCCSFSPMCFTHKTSAFSTSGCVTIQALFPDKAVGFAASHDWSSSYPFFDRCWERADCKNFKAPSALPAKCLMTSSCEMGWLESKYCTTWHWASHGVWVGLGLSWDYWWLRFEGCHCFLGHEGCKVHRACAHFEVSISSLQQLAWKVWILCSRGVFMAHRAY